MFTGVLTSASTPHGSLVRILPVERGRVGSEGAAAGLSVGVAGDASEPKPVLGVEVVLNLLRLFQGGGLFVDYQLGEATARRVLVHTDVKTDVLNRGRLQVHQHITFNSEF